MKSVYFFHEGNGKNKNLFGGKGAGLMEMTKLGLPVPPGFTITTKTCRKYFENGMKIPKGVMSEVKNGIRRMERMTGKKIGSDKNPLLVSVRSGAAISMPGMMDTILDLGLNEKSVVGLATSSGNYKFALDSYRRFIQIFGRVVFGIEDRKFGEALRSIQNSQGAKKEADFNE